MKLLKAIGLFCILLLAGPGAQAALQFDVFAGYESTIHEAAWFPITCEIYNDGPSFNAVIEVSGGPFGTEQVRQVPVELPTNTRKRIIIPMFASNASRMAGQVTWTGKLLDSNGKPFRNIDPRTASTRVVALESTIMGALPRNFGGSPVFPELRNNRAELKPEVARLTVDQFPDNPITLEGLSTFYLNSEKAPDLKVNQVTALLAWVRAGGHLIVSTEQISDINGTSWLKQFLPMELTDARNLRIDEEVLAWVQAGNTPNPMPLNRRNRRANQFNGTSTVDLPADSDFRNAELPIATGKLKDGKPVLEANVEGKTAALDEKIPLAVEAPRGRGKITLLTFSPEREPFRSWKARGYFWAKLAGIPPEFFNGAAPIGWGGTSTDGIFGALIDSRQIKKLPVTWLLLLLVVYLVVIGPFDQWWLKKIGRQMLTWITFPIYVVLFSLLIYFIGYKLRAGETEWNQLNIVDVLPRGDKVDLRGRSYVSIYSSGNATYPINGPQGHAAFRTEMADFRSSGNNDRVKVVQQGNTFKAEVFVPVWSSLLYASEWFQTNDIPFAAAVTDLAGDYQLEIENFLNQPLTDVRVAAGQKIFQVEPIPPNTRKTIRLESSKATDLRQFVRENGSYFQQAVAKRRDPLGEGGRLEDRPGTAVAASFISYLEDQPNRTFIAPPGLDISAQVDRGDAIVFTWLPGYSPTEKINAFSPPRFRQDTLLRLTIPIH